MRTKHWADLEHALKVGADGTLQVVRRVPQKRVICACAAMRVACCVLRVACWNGKSSEFRINHGARTVKVAQLELGVSGRRRGTYPGGVDLDEPLGEQEFAEELTHARIDLEQGAVRWRLPIQPVRTHTTHTRL